MTYGLVNIYILWVKGNFFHPIIVYRHGILTRVSHENDFPRASSWWSKALPLRALHLSPSRGDWDLRCDVRTEKNFGTQGMQKWDEPTHTLFNFSRAVYTNSKQAGWQMLQVNWTIAYKLFMIDHQGLGEQTPGSELPYGQTWVTGINTCKQTDLTRKGVQQNFVCTQIRSSHDH